MHEMRTIAIDDPGVYQCSVSLSNTADRSFAWGGDSWECKNIVLDGAVGADGNLTRRSPNYFGHLSFVTIPRVW